MKLTKQIEITVKLDLSTFITKSLCEALGYIDYLKLSPQTRGYLIQSYSFMTKKESAQFHSYTRENVSFILDSTA